MAAIVSSARSDSTGRRTVAVSGGNLCICRKTTRTRSLHSRHRAMKPRKLRGKTVSMTNAHRISNLAGVLVPFVALVVAIVLLWNTLVDWSDLAVMALMYALTGFGITVGFHRMLTHRSFATYKWL